MFLHANKNPFRFVTRLRWEIVVLPNPSHNVCSLPNLICLHLMTFSIPYSLNVVRNERERERVEVWEMKNIFCNTTLYLIKKEASYIHYSQFTETSQFYTWLPLRFAQVGTVFLQFKLG